MLMKRFRSVPAWQDWLINFQRSFVLLLAPWLVCVLAQSAGRGYLLLQYAAPGTYAALPQDVRRTLTTGLLFDIKVASIAFSALLLLSMAMAAKPRLQQRWQRCMPGVGATMALLFAAVTVISVFYFATFSRSIDIFVFGLVDDDTHAILMTLWHGYPLARAGLLLAAVLAGTWWLGRRWRACVQRIQFKRLAPGRGLIRLLLIIGITVVACRGSLGKFPLNKDDTSISSLRLLNDISSNGVSAFSWALSDRGNDKRFEPVTTREGRLLYERFLGWPDNGLRPFMAATGPNPAAAAQPPNVVLQIMESMGAHLNAYDRPGRDLLGALRPHWRDDWVFERFVAEGNGTIDSLSRLLVRSPISAIGQSSALDTPFVSNAFTPFLQRGYRVLFVTSGAATWRNLGVFATQLGAHEFVDQQTLRTRYPQAQAGTWGVPDEYMFRYIEERLAQSLQDGQPLFIIALSTTHHPPFIVPEGSPQGGLPMDDLTGLSYFKAWDVLAPALDTLRYANDQLGRFLTRVKAAPSAARTIVAVTGDHNILGIDYQNPKDAALAHAVPFYLYVPPAYRSQARYDPARVGSHKDILPTLYNLSLPETPYFRTGCDLLAAQPERRWCFGFNHKHVMLTDEGVFRPNKPGRILPWADASGLALADEQDATAEQWAEQVRMNAYPPLLQWQINYQVQELDRSRDKR